MTLFTQGDDDRRPYTEADLVEIRRLHRIDLGTLFAFIVAGFVVYGTVGTIILSLLGITV